MVFLNCCGLTLQVFLPGNFGKVVYLIGFFVIGKLLMENLGSIQLRSGEVESMPANKIFHKNMESL